MKIIASIYAYNFHLIVSYLNEGLQIVPFKDNRSKFYNSKAEYSFEIKNIGALTELQASKHILYGNSESKLTSFSMLSEETSNFPNIHQRQIPLDNVSQLTINYNQLDLFALSDTQGIYQIDISRPRHQEIINNFIPSSFEKLGNPSVSNIESSHDNLLIAVRNFGIVNIAVDKNKHRERKELRSEDPQDVKRLSLHDLIVVADSEEGIILYDFKNSRQIKKFKLPNNDFPQQIETTSAAIIIKGTLGLYAYYFTTDRLIVLREGKLGALTMYYDYIFFTSKGKLYSLTINDSFEKHGFTYDRQKIDLELVKSKS